MHIYTEYLMISHQFIKHYYIILFQHLLSYGYIQEII